MVQPTSIHYTDQTKQDLGVLSGFWVFRKKSFTYVANSSSANIYAYVCVLITTIALIVISSIIYMNFHTFYYFLGQGPLKDLTENFKGINSTGWLLGLSIDNIMYIMLPAVFLPLVSVSIAKLFNKKAIFSSGFRIACVSYVVVVLSYIIDFVSEMLYHSATGIAFSPVVVDDIGLLFVAWFAALYIYGLSITLGINIRDSFILSIIAYIIAILIDGLIIIVVIKFLGIIFMWIFPVT